MIAKPYGQVTNQMFGGNINFGPKDREFDNLNPKDKYATNNNMQFHDDERSAYDKLHNAAKRPNTANM